MVDGLAAQEVHDVAGLGHVGSNGFCGIHLYVVEADEHGEDGDGIIRRKRLKEAPVRLKTLIILFGVSLKHLDDVFGENVMELSAELEGELRVGRSGHSEVCDRAVGSALQYQ